MPERPPHKTKSNGLQQAVSLGLLIVVASICGCVSPEYLRREIYARQRIRPICINCHASANRNKFDDWHPPGAPPLTAGPAPTAVRTSRNVALANSRKELSARRSPAGRHTVDQAELPLINQDESPPLEQEPASPPVNQLVEQTPEENRDVPIVRVLDSQPTVPKEDREQPATRGEIRQVAAHFKVEKMPLATGIMTECLEDTISSDNECVSPNASNISEFVEKRFERGQSRSSECENERAETSVKGVTFNYGIKIKELFRTSVNSGPVNAPKQAFAEIQTPRPVSEAVQSILPRTSSVAVVKPTQIEASEPTSIPDITNNPLRPPTSIADELIDLQLTESLAESGVPSENEPFSGQINSQSLSSQSHFPMFVRLMRLTWYWLRIAAGMLFGWCGLVLLVLGLGDRVIIWRPLRQFSLPEPHRYLRNPLTTATCLVLLGLSFLLCSVALFVLTNIFVLVSTLYFRYINEPALERRLGEVFKTYKANVRLWFPRVHPWAIENEEVGRTPGMSRQAG